MTIGILKEKRTGETRVAVVPRHIAPLCAAGHTVMVEKGAGIAAGFGDTLYKEAGAQPIDDRAKILSSADVVLAVSSGAVDSATAKKDMAHLRAGSTVIGFLSPYSAHPIFKEYSAKNINTISMELIPRITRAQSMDALSSMANLGGYRAVIMAAEASPGIFPLMMTAAGTIVAYKLFVIGVGVAGLQAIATARRLGALVSAYDVRPQVREQVESLGARFIEMELDSKEGKGGYAAQMDEEFYTRQRELMGDMVAQNDVVITTAAIPGKPSPVLIDEKMVARMHPGAVIVDLAAENGGNCALTQSGKRIVHNGVTIIGDTNLPAKMPHDASMLYSRNITTLLAAISDKEKVQFNLDDEIVDAVLVTHNGTVHNKSLKEQLGL